MGQRRAGPWDPAEEPYRYSYFDHTADVGFEAEAASLPGLLVAAAEAVLHLLLERPPRLRAGGADVAARAPGSPGTAREGGHAARLQAILAAPDLEGLMVRWINEVLYWVQVQGLVPTQLSVRVMPNVAAGRVPATPPGSPILPGAGQRPRVSTPGAEQRPREGAAEGAGGDAVPSSQPGPGAGPGPARPEEGWRLEAAAAAVPLDPDGMGWQGEIKAATYHQLVVAPAGDPAGRWRARVILDV